MRQKKRFTITALILTLLCMVSILNLNVYANHEDTIRLTIIHINDTHGRTQAEPYISALAKDLKDMGENVLILDAGDRLHGQTTTNLSKGESMAGIMNAVGYDAMVPGNHDFNFGVERLLELSGLVNFPMLTANVYKDGINLFESYKIFDLSGVRAGVFGITTPETVAKSDPRLMTGLTFGDPAQSAEALVSELQAQGCDVIIALAHLGDDGSSAPADRSDALAAVAGIDVIIDGHSHTLLENGRLVNGTLIAQAGEHAQHIGVVEIAISSGNITKTARVISVPSDDEEPELIELIPDESIIAKIAEEDAKVEHITSTVVSYTPVILQGEREQVRTGETNLANLVTDSMRHATGADISFVTGGNIRASIPAGDITMGHILTTLPYSNLLVTVELGGADLLTALEHGVSLYPEPAGQFIQVSGIHFEFDPDAEPMNRITEVTMASGEAFDIDKRYTVAAIEFLAAGGDGYTMLANGANLVYYGDDAEAFADYLATNPTINAESEGRITTADASGNTANDNLQISDRTILWLWIGGISFIGIIVLIVIIRYRKRASR